ncbi:hypothetical protein Ga0100231_018375 [Opitutaceae bacterium TAV4]|nr:hypothetical protein Ga0100231_018375 [Opitutaceae bacterium TAV4]RRK00090.1 hypothetical protein Ga0100230_019080 [Opitutaceae bacterium TAV3]
MNTSKTVRTLLALATACATLVTTATAALVITTADITNNTYTFKISFDDLASNTKFSNALHSSANIFGANTESSGANERRYVTPDAGTTAATFVIAFDVSKTGYEITSLSIKDSLYINNTGAGTIKGESLWTTNLAEPGTQIRVIASSGSPQSTSSQKNYTLTQASSIVYYTVNFTATGTTFAAKNTQWNRGGPDTANFEVTLNLTPTQVPEPATTTLLTSASVLLAILGIRQVRRIRKHRN